LLLFLTFLVPLCFPPFSFSPPPREAESTRHFPRAYLIDICTPPPRTFCGHWSQHFLNSALFELPPPFLNPRFPPVAYVSVRRPFPLFHMNFFFWSNHLLTWYFVPPHLFRILDFHIKLHVHPVTLSFWPSPFLAIFFLPLLSLLPPFFFCSLEYRQLPKSTPMSLVLLSRLTVQRS